MGFFDSLNMQKVAMGTCTAAYGYSATWVKDEGHTYTAKVLYGDNGGDPSIGEKGSAKLGNKTFDVDYIWMEFTKAEFPGLSELIKGNKQPRVTIALPGGDVVYACLKVAGDSDGLVMQTKLRLAATQ